MDTDRGCRRHGGDEPDGGSGGVPSRAARSANAFEESRSRRRVLRSIAGFGTSALVGSVGAHPLAGRPRTGTGDAIEGNGTGDSRSSRGGMQVGIHTGSGIDAIRRTDHIESWIGSGFDVQNVFIPFDDAGYELDELFGRVLPAIWAAGRTPVLTWELHLSSGSTPTNVVERVTAGDYDDYLAEWTDRMSRAIAEADADWTRRPNEPAVYVRLAHEANGNWYPWAPASGESTPTEYVDMWRYVYSHVERAPGVRSRLAWIWAVNGVDIGPYTMEELYPGDAFVDWIGLDNYNWGTSQPWSDWQSPEELFAGPIERVRDIPERDVPIGVTELASSSMTRWEYDVERKAAWIREAFETLDRAGVDMAVWFNRDRKTDWAVFGGERGTDRIELGTERCDVYSAYRDEVVERL